MEHHARLYVGDLEIGIGAARAWAEGRTGGDVSTPTEVYVYRSDYLAVEEVRALKERAAQKPYGAAQTFVLATSRIMHEAQNALLKLLEEPPEGTYLALVVPSEDLLLPTVLSRLSHGGRHAGSPVHERAAEFVKASPALRLALVSKLGIIEERDRNQAAHFLNALEVHYYGDGSPDTLSAHKTALSEIMFVRRYLYDKGSSLKMLFEHLALTLPTVVSH